jgi:hypothetical protein
MKYLHPSPILTDQISSQLLRATDLKNANNE